MCFRTGAHFASSLQIKQRLGGIPRAVLEIGVGASPAISTTSISSNRPSECLQTPYKRALQKVHLREELGKTPFLLEVRSLLVEVSQKTVMPYLIRNHRGEDGCNRL